MADWLLLGGYLLGWALSIRLAVKCGWWDPDRDGLLTLAFIALFWPLWAAIAVVVSVFGGLAWLATADLRRRKAVHDD